MPEPLEINEITDRIIGSAIAIHRELGPGLLESTYEACLAYALTSRGLSVQRQVPMPVVYQGKRLSCGYRVDLLVEEAVIVELKSVARLDRVHTAQLLTYLKLSGCRVGLLINFQVEVLKAGIRRVVRDYDGPKPARAARA